MIRLKITPEQIKRARTRFDFEALPASITAGRHNLFGAVGEVLVLDYYKNLGLNIHDKQALNFDFIIEGKTVDIKSRVVKRTPAKWYTCDVPRYSVERQETEFYIFVYVREDMAVGWIAGYISKEDFKSLARLYKKGEPKNYTGTFPIDTLQIICRQLNGVKLRTKEQIKNDNENERNL